MICLYVYIIRDVKSIFGANGIIKKTFSASAIQGTMVNKYFFTHIAIWHYNCFQFLLKKFK